MFKKAIKRAILIIGVGLSTIALTGCGETLQNFVQHDIAAQMSSRVRSNIDMANSLHESGFLDDEVHKSIIKDLEEKQDLFNPNKNVSESELKELTKYISAIRVVTGNHITEANGGNGKIEGNIDVEGELANGDKLAMGTDPLSLVDYLIFNDKTFGDPTKVELNKKDKNGKVTTVDLTKADKQGNIGGNGAGKLNEGQYSTNKIGGYKDYDNIEGYKLIDGETNDEINKRLGCEVYTLKADVLESGGSLDGIIELVNQLVSGKGPTEINHNHMKKYFEPSYEVKYNKSSKKYEITDKKLTLIDMTNKDNYIIKKSTPNIISSNKNKLGKDLIISQYNMPILSIKLEEFNKENIDNLNETIGLLNEGKFVFGNNRVYVMEYPISYISGFRSTSKNNYEAEIRQSGLALNILTGSILKYNSYDEETDTWSADATKIGDMESCYLTVGENEGEDKSSFIVKGYNIIPLGIDSNAKKTKYGTAGKLILRDYLEATYMPDYAAENGDKALVVLGRKLRINFPTKQDSWKETNVALYITEQDVKKNVDLSAFNKNNKKSILLDANENAEKIQTHKNTLVQIASDKLKDKFKSYKPVWKKNSALMKFVDAEGNIIKGSGDLKIYNLCDYRPLNYEEDSTDSLGIKGPYVRRIAKSTEDIKKTTKAKSGYDIKNVSELPIRTVGNNVMVKTTVQFPGLVIGNTDYAADNDNKHRYYAMATCTGIFDTALYSGWINSNSETASLNWWSEYLKTNGYLYKVSKKDIEDFLVENYRYELTQEGAIILDLDTVARIQKIFDKDANNYRASLINTVFVIIGVVLVWFSFLLLLLWILDTSTDLGLNLLEKATFGNWVAIKYESDIHGIDTGNQTYMTAPKLIIRCLIIIAVGYLLIKVNVLEIALMFIEMFGKAAQVIQDTFKGIS